MPKRLKPGLVLPAPVFQLVSVKAALNGPDGENAPLAEKFAKAACASAPPARGTSKPLPVNCASDATVCAPPAPSGANAEDAENSAFAAVIDTGDSEPLAVNRANWIGDATPLAPPTPASSVPAPVVAWLCILGAKRASATKFVEERTVLWVDGASVATPENFALALISVICAGVAANAPLAAKCADALTGPVLLLTAVTKPLALKVA